MYEDDSDEKVVVIVKGKTLAPKLVMPMSEALDLSGVVDCPVIEENVESVVEGSRLAEAAGSTVLEAAEPAVLDEICGSALVGSAGSTILEV